MTVSDANVSLSEAIIAGAKSGFGSYFAPVRWLWSFLTGNGEFRYEAGSAALQSQIGTEFELRALRKELEESRAQMAKVALAAQGKEDLLRRELHVISGELQALKLTIDQSENISSGFLKRSEELLREMDQRSQILVSQVRAAAQPKQEYTLLRQKDYGVGKEIVRYAIPPQPQIHYSPWHKDYADIAAEMVNGKLVFRQAEHGKLSYRQPEKDEMNPSHTQGAKDWDVVLTDLNGETHHVKLDPTRFVKLFQPAEVHQAIPTSQKGLLAALGDLFRGGLSSDSRRR